MYRQWIIRYSSIKVNYFFLPNHLDKILQSPAINLNKNSIYLLIISQKREREKERKHLFQQRKHQTKSDSSSSNHRSNIFISHCSFIRKYYRSPSQPEERRWRGACTEERGRDEGVAGSKLYQGGTANSEHVPWLQQLRNGRKDFVERGSNPPPCRASSCRANDARRLHHQSYFHYADRSCSALTPRGPRPILIIPQHPSSSRISQTRSCPAAISDFMPPFCPDNDSKGGVLQREGDE